MKIDDDLVCTESILTDDEIINKFTMIDDGVDDDGCSSDNNEDDEKQVIKLTKVSVDGALDTLMTYTICNDKHADEICRLTSKIGALFEGGSLTHARQQSFEQYFNS